MRNPAPVYLKAQLTWHGRLSLVQNCSLHKSVQAGGSLPQTGFKVQSPFLGFRGSKLLFNRTSVKARDPDPTSQDKPDPDPTSQDKPNPEPTSQDKPVPDP